MQKPWDEAHVGGHPSGAPATYASDRSADAQVKRGRTKRSGMAQTTWSGGLLYGKLAEVAYGSE